MLKSVKDFANSKITRTFAKFSADNEISLKAKRKLKDLQQTRVVQEQIKNSCQFLLNKSSATGQEVKRTSGVLFWYNKKVVINFQKRK